MQRQGRNGVQYGLDQHGIKNLMSVGWNLTTPALYEEIVRRREGLIAEDGPVVVRTGKYTGRSPKDKFIVREPGERGEYLVGQMSISRWSRSNSSRSRSRMLSYLRGQELYRAGLLRGRGPALPPQCPRHHRAGMARAFHAQPAHPCRTR